MTDSVVLARFVGGVCLVINNIDIAKKSYYYYYQYYYSYYGDEDEASRSKPSGKRHRTPKAHVG